MASKNQDLQHSICTKVDEFLTDRLETRSSKTNIWLWVVASWPQTVRQELMTENWVKGIRNCLFSLACLGSFLKYILNVLYHEVLFFSGFIYNSQFNRIVEIDCSFNNPHSVYLLFLLLCSTNVLQKFTPREMIENKMSCTNFKL